jgi:hypothetical protein
LYRQESVKNVYRTSVGKLARKRLIVRYRRRHENIIETNLKEVGFEGVD